MYEDQISLRYYVALLLRRWKWIALAGFFAALAAFAVTLLQPATYEATASVAVIRSRTDVSFNDSIRTLDDYELGGGRLAGDRLAALVSLTESNEVLAAVLEDIGEQLPPAERTVKGLRRTLETATTGDLIELTVRHENPDVPPLLANSWAQAYVRYVNQLYGSRGDDFSIIASQVAASRESYEAAQESLEEFLAGEDVLALRRQLERELNAKNELLGSYQQAVVAIETNDAMELAQIEAWLADARTLREQVSAGSRSNASNLGDMLALILLRSRVYGGLYSVRSDETSNQELGSTGGAGVARPAGPIEQVGPVALQLDLASVESEGIDVADVDNLIRVLEVRRTATQERIAALDAESDGSQESNSVAVGQALNRRIDALIAEIIELETRLASEVSTREAQRRELEAARDRAWDAYQALTAQQIEAEIQVQSTGTEVRTADLASAPAERVDSAVIVSAVLAAIVGVMVAVGIVFLIEWWFAGGGVEEQEEDEPSTGDHTQHDREQDDLMQGKHQQLPDATS